MKREFNGVEMKTITHVIHDAFDKDMRIKYNAQELMYLLERIGVVGSKIRIYPRGVVKYYYFNEWFEKLVEGHYGYYYNTRKRDKRDVTAIYYDDFLAERLVILYKSIKRYNLRELDWKKLIEDLINGEL